MTLADRLAWLNAQMAVSGKTKSADGKWELVPATAIIKNAEHRARVLATHGANETDLILVEHRKLDGARHNHWRHRIQVTE